MPTNFYPDANPETSSVDGYAIRSGTDLTWADIRDGAGTSADASGTVNSPLLQASTTSNRWTSMMRDAYLFDTSSIGAGNNPTAATLNFYVEGKLDNFSQSVDVVDVAPASDTDIIAADYTTFGTTSFGSVAISSVTSSSWNSITLNASGLAAISLTGITKFGLRLSGDRTNTEPTWSSGGYSFINIRTADYAGDTYTPYLRVTYPGSAAGGSRMLLMGVGRR